MLAAITGSGLLYALLWVVVAGAFFYLAEWFMGYVGAQDPFKMIGRVIIGIIVFALLLNALLSAVNRPFIRLW
jgi:hypothetical protein